MDKYLIACTAQLFGVRGEDITNPMRRGREITLARSAIAWVLLRTRPSWSRQQIADAIGAADRKSVYNSDKRAEDLRRRDRSYQTKLDKLLLIAGRHEISPAPPPKQQPREERQPFQPDPLARWAVSLQGGTWRQASAA